ncbi:MAG: amidohydrolase family protein [Lachnospiraceae bacterium]|nr:amidohydrolase family protein [Lachnospiraceae bacterium]
MIIDVHTHTFPDKIAKATLEHMEKEITRWQNFAVKAEREGTAGALEESSRQAGIDISLICPVATNTRQPEKINRLAPEINEKTGETHLFTLGAIHPECVNYKQIIDEIVAMELRGIKIHPDYQNTFIDDEKYIRMIDYAADKDLAIIVHAGQDVGIPSVVHCPPDRFLNLWKHIQPEKFILAHMGGWRMWDEVLEKIAGMPVYFDTAVALNKNIPVYMSNEEFVTLVRKHGADKVLFGTDTPWYDQKQALADIKATGLDDNELRLVLGENARKLFGF